MTRPFALSLVLVLTLAFQGAAQTVTAERFALTTGPCTLRSGSGAPSSGLGAVCDTYVRTDSPYTVYVKTGASTWSPVVAEPGSTGLTTVGALGTGSITSGFGAIDVGADGITGGAFSGTTGAFTTSVTTPTLTHGSSLTLAPTGDVIFNPTGNDLLPTTGYDLNIGALTNKFLTLHAAELWVETLVAQDTLATIGGRVLVGPTTTLTADLLSGAESIQVKHNQIASGDRLVLQANGQLEWLAVTSGASGSAGAYIYSVTRNLDGSGANNWTAGDAVFNTGTTGDGFIDLYSVNGVIPGSTVGPTIVGNVRTGTTYSNIDPRWAIGNLNGLYGYSADTYGAAFGSPSAAWIKIDPTNGLRIGHNTTTKIELDASGNASFVQGDVSIDENGILLALATSGVTSDSNSYRFNAGGGGQQIGLYGYRDSGDTIRTLQLRNSNAADSTLSVTAVSGDVAVLNLTATGGGSSTGTINLSAGPLGATKAVVFDGTAFTVPDHVLFSTDATTLPAAGIGQTSGAGLTLRGIAGSTYDLQLRDASNNNVIGVPTGTAEVVVAGVAGDGTGKVVCIKSDTTLGTCNATTITTSGCTCS